ncbi:hypothetical protein [Ferrovum sp.]|uniref:hypothetical protein n=1 Tax=Ferrovum sp. TaxID=2609467 RepID=UPI0026190E74|nr:hypothetical protein [Ferrovum sp.]
MKMHNPQRVHRVKPLGWWYGEPLPEDYLTNPKYIFKPGRMLTDFYATDQDLKSADNETQGA